jgi:predicted regulator of Ras-like GTPase activity (Roadblock/LC7/MglB family)
MRIPFKISAPSDDIRPKPEPWLTKASLAAEAAAAAPTPASLNSDAASGATMIKLELRPILEMLPPMQLAGDVDDVPSGAEVELPFSLVEPQLVTGRVMIAPEQFAAALPPAYSFIFNAAATPSPVSLPLQEVLKNLPNTSLRMRDDQEEQEKGANFETPFSAKAAEDAKRLNVAATPVAKPTLAEEPASMTEPTADATAPQDSASLQLAPEDVQAGSLRHPPEAPGDRNALQTALDTDETLDAKAVVAHVGKMDGVEACAIMFGDGLSLAGNMPKNYGTEGLCAMAPALLQRVENHMVETQLGALRAMTLSCAKAAITFFMHENLCLAALHAKEELNADIRDRLGRTVKELSRQYSNPA